MKLLFKTALRTLVRNKRRTGITIVSIAMSLAVIFWIQSVMATRADYLIDKILSLSGGDIQIFKKVYFEDKRLADVIKGPIPDLAAAVGEGAQTAQRIRLPGLIAAAEESFPIFLNGVDPIAEANVSKIKDFLVRGDFLTVDADGSCAERPIYIGEKLADLLRVDIGGKVVFLGQAADGTLGNELFRVKGIFNSRSGDFDKVYAFTTISCTQKVGVLEGIHEVAYKLKYPSRIDQIEADVNKVLPEDLVGIGWKQANPMVAQMLRFNDGIIALLTTILVSIVIFGTVNTMLMSVHERAKEFGVMLALGMQPRQLMATIVIEAFLMALTGFVCSFVLGAAVIAYHKFYGFDLSVFIGKSATFQGLSLDTNMVYPEFAVVPFLKAASFMVVFVTLAGIFPAYRAGRLTPVDTIRG